MRMHRGSKTKTGIILLNESASASIRDLLVLLLVCFAILSYRLWAQHSNLREFNDYDGDSKSDLAVYAPGTQTWSIQTSGNPNGNFSVQWGTPSDIRVPGDYDGDGKTDVAFWRPSDWDIGGRTDGRQVDAAG
jgi:hypothetical protein